MRAHACTAFAALALASGAASADPDPSPAEQPPPSVAAPGALVPPPGSSPGYGAPYQPGYGAPAYGPGYGYRYGPAVALPPPPPTCCRWSARFDPFDLVYRRLTFIGEFAVAGPFAVQIEPTWIFGSSIADTDAKGFAIAGDAVFYLGGRALRGFWLKAHGGYERYQATVTNHFVPTNSTTQTLSSGILGALFGSSLIFGRDGGFALSAGLGIGYATSPEVDITAAGQRQYGTETQSFY
ncbi:MAG TPA: hypothetical protein VGM56_19275, partial [Byssovorax sp.]